MLFVDTEGLGSTSRTQTEDSQIFSLALLLSSMFVWNSRGVIDGNALEDFALVVNLTKHIHVRSNAASKAVAKADTSKSSSSSLEKGKARFVASSSGGLGSGGSGSGRQHELEALADHFPSFMWVVRDFTLRLEDGGRKINDRQYLENALKPQQSFTSEAASRNQIRTLLSSFFRERDCVTLVRPAEDEATLRNLKNVPLEQLRPEFQAGLKTLKNKLYAALRPKAVNGRALTGAMLATLAQTYVEALNSGGVPTISTAWDRVLQSQAAEAVAKALEAYDRKAAEAPLGARSTDLAMKLLAIKALPKAGKAAADRHSKSQENEKDIHWVVEDLGGLPVEAKELRVVHDAAALEAEAVFSKAVWASSDAEDDSARSGRDESASQLDKALRGRRRRLEELNEACSEVQCMRMLEELLTSVLHLPRESDAETASDKGKKSNFSDLARERLARYDEQDFEGRKSEYGADLRERRTWLAGFLERYTSFREAYAQKAKGPAKWDVFCDHATGTVLAAFLGWATELGVGHRAMAKLARADIAALDEKQQTAAGKVSASKSASKRELDALERAAAESDANARAVVASLDDRIEVRKTELQRHAASIERLASAYDFATTLHEKQNERHKELIEDMKRSLSAIRRAVRHDDDQGDGGRDSSSSELAGAAWDAADLGFEREEMAEFAPLSMAELKERIAEDEKELELMHEHAALTIEHAKVKKMLLADKDHELQEYEYQ